MGYFYVGFERIGCVVVGSYFGLVEFYIRISFFVVFKVRMFSVSISSNSVFLFLLVFFVIKFFCLDDFI